MPADPNRLEHLKSIRDDRYAILRTKTDAARDAAARVAVLKQRAEKAELEAARAATRELTDRLRREAKAARDAATEAEVAFEAAKQAEAKASEAWNEANRLYERAEAWALENGIPTPKAPVVHGPHRDTFAPTIGEVR